MEQENSQHREMHMGWGRFVAMIVTSIVIMFLLMYQLVYGWDHVTFSVNRFVASLVMGCVMTVVMLAFMWPMYQGTGVKTVILVAGSVLGVVLLYVNRSQSLVGDIAFMESMIPHHSIAINNARKAGISDPRVRELADQIIESQLLEIAEMKRLIDEIGRDGGRGDGVVPARSAEAVAEAEHGARERSASD